MKSSRPISESESEALLPDGNRIHVFVESGGELYGQDWPRSAVMERIRAHGAELSGDEARRANHGLASVGPNGAVFIQTRLEAKT